MWHSVPGQGSAGLEGAGGPGGSEPEAGSRDVREFSAKELADFGSRERCEFASLTHSKKRAELELDFGKKNCVSG